MTDLAVLVPSRGRPHNVARLISACKRTCAGDVLLAFGFDEDDPALADNLAALSWNASATVRPRMGLAPWTNELAALHPDAAWLASLGDDMEPVTPGWDVKLCAAAGPRGMAYPDDQRRDDVPEAVVMAAAVVKALGWMCPPGFDHWYIDNTWRDIGAGAGCLTYAREVTVKHWHPNVTNTPGDPTYWDAAPKMGADLAAYQKWRLARDGMRAAIERVRNVPV